MAIAVADFITGPLAENPRRVGKELNEPLHGVHSARVARDWRILYIVDAERHVS